MQIPSWLIVGAAVVMALPFGWGLGLLVAYIVAGKNFGQLPAATVPLASLLRSHSPYGLRSVRVRGSR